MKIAYYATQKNVRTGGSEGTMKFVINLKEGTEMDKRSRHKKYWRRIVKLLLYEYPLFGWEDNPMDAYNRNVINWALNETRKLPNGDSRCKAVEMFYFKQSHTIPGISIELQVSERTIGSWFSEFIAMIGKKIGYIN